MQPSATSGWNVVARDIWTIARFEGRRLLGSWRALFVIGMYLALSALTGMSYVKAAQLAEEQAVKLMQQNGVPDASADKLDVKNSEAYQAMLKQLAGNDASKVSAWKDTPIIVLVSYYLALLFLPLLLTLTTHDIFARDNEIGTFRYVRPRASIESWVLGKYLAHTILAFSGTVLSAGILYLIARSQLSNFDAVSGATALLSYWWRLIVFILAVIGVISAISAGSRTSFTALIGTAMGFFFLWLIHWMRYLDAEGTFASLRFVAYLSPFTYRDEYFDPIGASFALALAASFGFTAFGVFVARRALSARKG